MERLNAANINWQGEEVVTALATNNDKAVAMVEVDGVNIRSLRIFNV